MPPKVADKLTDAEKKKIKQANKAKANPNKADEKAKINMKRRIARGQITDPSLVTESKDKKDKKDPKDTSVEDEPLSVVKKTVKRTDAEKDERMRLKILAIENALKEKQRLEAKQRMQNMLYKQPCVNDNEVTSETQPCGDDKEVTSETQPCGDDKEV